MDDCGIEALEYLMRPNSTGSLIGKRDSSSTSLSGPSWTFGQPGFLDVPSPIFITDCLKQISLQFWQKAPSHDGVSLGSLAVLYMALQAHSTLAHYSNPTDILANISVIFVHSSRTGKEWYEDIMIAFHTISDSSRALLLAYAPLTKYNLVALCS